MPGHRSRSDQPASNPAPGPLTPEDLLDEGLDETFPASDATSAASVLPVGGEPSGRKPPARD
jgi:hypothetical protein